MYLSIIIVTIVITILVDTMMKKLLIPPLRVIFAECYLLPPDPKSHRLFTFSWYWYYYEQTFDYRKELMILLEYLPLPP